MRRTRKKKKKTKRSAGPDLRFNLVSLVNVSFTKSGTEDSAFFERRSLIERANCSFLIDQLFGQLIGQLFGQLIGQLIGQLCLGCST